MKFLFIAFLLIVANTSISQTRWDGAVFLQDGNGNWIDPKPNYKTEGSPFFIDSYAPARLTVGKKTYVMQAKLNLADNTVHFDHEGNEMVSARPVERVEFYKTGGGNQMLTFKSGFPSVGNNTPLSYYQVLDSGKAILLKYIGIKRRESVPYNSATRLTVFDRNTKYYVFLNNKMSEIKNMDDLTDVTNDQKAKMKTFISSAKLKPNKEADLITFFGFYNSL